MKKTLLISVILLIYIGISGYQKPDVYIIDAEKNSSMHNNLGLMHMSENNYYAAIQEYKIAISLNSKSQASAVYYNNLGEVYMKIANYSYAQDCFENAIRIYPLNFVYYQNLVKSFKYQKTINYQIKNYSLKSNNPLNLIVLGLSYIEKGDVKRGIIKLDEFCMKEPKLIITSGVKEYLDELAKNY